MQFCDIKDSSNTMRTQWSLLLFSSNSLKFNFAGKQALTIAILKGNRWQQRNQMIKRKTIKGKRGNSVNTHYKSWNIQYFDNSLWLAE